MINHTFVIYSYVGSFIALLLAMILFKMKLVRDTRQKAKLLFLPLALPVSIFILYQFVFKKPCTVGFLTWTTSGSTSWYDQICILGYYLSEKLIPFFIVAGIFGFIKASLSIWYSSNLLKKYGEADSQEYHELYEIILELSKEMALDLPRLVVVPGLRPKAFICGLKKPTIVLSRGLLKLLSQEEVTMVLAHEMAHILRKDVALNWLGVLLRDVMFFNPVAHWAFSMYQKEKEKAADIHALEIINEPVEYAATLLKLWKAQKSFSLEDLVIDNLSPYPGFFAKTKLIESRIRMALDYEPESRGNTRVFKSSISISVVTAIVLAFVC